MTDSQHSRQKPSAPERRPRPSCHRGALALFGLTAWLTLWAGAISLSLPHEAFGHDAHRGPDRKGRVLAGQQAGSDATVDVKLLDLELVDKRGNPVKFQSEAIGDRIVVIDFVYTRCTTVCPVLSQVLALVQDGLGDRLNGQDIRLVSISVDPTADTPARLNAFAVRFGAGPAWWWLTGRKHDIDRVLDALGAYTPDFADHPSMVLVGDGRNGGWTRFYGFPSPDRILAKINELVAIRDTTKTSWKTGD